MDFHTFVCSFPAKESSLGGDANTPCRWTSRGRTAKQCRRKLNAQRLYAMRRRAHYKDCGIMALRAKWILSPLFVQAVATVLPQGHGHTWFDALHNSVSYPQNRRDRPPRITEWNQVGFNGKFYCNMVELVLFSPRLCVLPKKKNIREPYSVCLKCRAVTVGYEGSIIRTFWFRSAVSANGVLLINVACTRGFASAQGSEKSSARFQGIQLY